MISRERLLQRRIPQNESELFQGKLSVPEEGDIN